MAEGKNPNITKAREQWNKAERENRLREHRASCPCGANYGRRYIAGFRPFTWLAAETGRLKFRVRHWSHRGRG